MLLKATNYPSINILSIIGMKLNFPVFLNMPLRVRQEIVGTQRLIAIFTNSDGVAEGIELDAFDTNEIQRHSDKELYVFH